MKEQWQGSCEGCPRLEKVLKWKEGAQVAETWAGRTDGYRLASPGAVACWGLMPVSEEDRPPSELDWTKPLPNPCTAEGVTPVIEVVHFDSPDFSVTEPLNVTRFPF